MTYRPPHDQLVRDALNRLTKPSAEMPSPDWTGEQMADWFFREMLFVEEPASVDTHPKGGDVEQAPSPMGSAMAKPDAHA